MLGDLTADLPSADARAADDARRLWSALAMPPGALGDLQNVGVRLAGLTGRCPPPVPLRPAVLVAAADHGVTEQEVSAWPRSVTAAMVRTVLEGRAAVSAIAEVVGASVTVLDVGVDADLPGRPGLVSAKVRRATADLSLADAMTAGELAAAVRAGHRAAARLMDGGADLLALGEVGIGNTTAAACLVAALTGAPARDVVGPGAGVDRDGRVRKTAVVDRVLERLSHGGASPASTGDAPGHRPSDPPGDPLSHPWAVLAACGGLEHAALVGAVLAAAARRTPVLLDGVNSVAVALVAAGVAPAVQTALFAGHLSTEPGAARGLDRLGLLPLQRLHLRLGEGTGALLAVPLIQAAARCMTDMARLADL